jgi:plastocyanin
MKKILSAITICLLFALKAYSFTQIVTVQNHVFTPSTFTINLGDTIKWTWINGSHTTTSLAGIPAGAAAWNHSINTSNKTFIYVPAVAGLYHYKCTPHQAIGMVGNFTVAASCPPASAQISASSATTFCKGGSVLLTSTTSANITAYQWENNGTGIGGATAPTYTATVAGSYTLMVTNNCGNTATSNAISVKVNSLPKATITPSGTVNICTGDSVVLQASVAASQTFQWQKNATNISGATGTSYTAKTAGNYRVIVTKTTTGCIKNSPATKVVISSCLISSNNNTIKVFPNPSSGDFHISVPSYKNDQYSLSVFDGSGNLIGNKKIASNDFSFGGELKPGIYLIRVKNGNAVIFEEKIIKQ